ncbi:unnamed protein product [Rotaria magnacalcarata]|uniref:Uncharacterized protein n=1 Tax=Rotaria magnacalcarata TaxID=392030 RepID=A0A819RAJ7_9BILA|nr:unnamed protein product [Rotaria magnacalcarata]CAF2149907.1 unnamed protein product [Rotaria magnacalcarata]CAF4041279.1 unnamed protein product [Rotaria magnacalcarata]CAF4193953.1 unnamed protein product [Rotaria magnacalcarata]CAF4433226.1 unnamed protein product [Rotaria magnacalcarata]
MPSKKSNLIKSCETCLKQKILAGKKYGSDFKDGFIDKRYTQPPYSWNMNVSTSDNKKVNKQSNNKKSTPRKIKTNASRKSKSQKR